MKLNSMKNKKAGGFALLETILAGAVLTLGVVAVMGLVSSNLKFSLDARNHDIAVLLAQEGVELVRNIRDNNWAAGHDSFQNLPDRDDCRVDMNSSNVQCGGETKLILNGNDFYEHGGGTATRFSRRIGIDYQDGGKTAEVTSMVIWSGSSFPGSSYDSCNLAKHCAFSKITLSKWGGQ